MAKDSVKNNKTKKKLLFCFVSIIILILLFNVSLFGFIEAKLSLGDNNIKTGNISICLNGNNKIFDDNDYYIQPGDIVKKSFYIENDGENDVYFKIYFDNLEGTYFDYIYVEIKNEEGVIICEGLMNELSKENVESKDDALCASEKRNFEISIIFLEEAGNDYQDEKIDFEIIVMATQTKNNPNRDFD